MLGIARYVMAYLLFLLCIPLFFLYFLLCLLSPRLRFGSVRRGRGSFVYVVGDLVHSDYLFRFDEFPEFGADGGWVKVGWGDRRIFLETQTWGELRVEDFLRAFFGLNPTVLRVDFLEGFPVGADRVEMGRDQMEVLKAYVRGSFFGSPIERRPSDYQGGVFYRSALGYNCVTNCNNWVNRGLWLAGASNRVWAPLSFWR